jgi:hypothetical protein
MTPTTDVEDDALLSRLERVAAAFGFRIRYEPCEGKGGACVLRGEKLIIVDDGKSAAQKLDIIARALADCDTEDVYLPPVVREAIEARRRASGP